MQFPAIGKILKGAALAGAMMLASFGAQAQSAVTPTVGPFQMGIDWRRSANPNLEAPGKWINFRTVSVSTVVSLTSPVSATTGYVKYNISPVTAGWGGNLCDYLVRNNATATPTFSGNLTDGTSWEKNRKSGWIEPGTSQFVSIYIPAQGTVSNCNFTVTWESMIVQ